MPPRVDISEESAAQMIGHLSLAGFLFNAAYRTPILLSPKRPRENGVGLFGPLLKRGNEQVFDREKCICSPEHFCGALDAFCIDVPAASRSRGPVREAQQRAKRGARFPPQWRGPPATPTDPVRVEPFPRRQEVRSCCPLACIPAESYLQAAGADYSAKCILTPRHRQTGLPNPMLMPTTNPARSSVSLVASAS